MRGDNPIPGEHHFVAAYLAPKLFSMNKKVPCYINPDGTKGIRGDIVYYENNQHKLGIEAKLGKIHLTPNEFNQWIVSSDESKWPEIFAGIGETGIVIAPWGEFRETYIKTVRKRRKNWVPIKIEKNYGPIRSVDQILKDIDDGYKFVWSHEEKEWEGLEIKLTDHLVKISSEFFLDSTEEIELIKNELNT